MTVIDRYKPKFIIHASVSVIFQCLCKTVTSEAHCAVIHMCNDPAWIVSHAANRLCNSPVDLSDSAVQRSLFLVSLLSAALRVQLTRQFCPVGFVGRQCLGL